MYERKCVTGNYENDGFSICSDPVMAIDFASPEGLNLWTKENTSLSCENEDYGIKGIFYPDYADNGKH